MAVPTVMADLSTTAASNSPAGSEAPISTDDFHRAIQAILRHTNAKGADIASATTTDIGAATGEFVDVTGTTTITGLGTIAAGIERTVRFTGALTLTHNGTSLLLPGAANITTAANDRALFRSLGSGNWLCIAYVRADGSPVNAFVDTNPLVVGSSDATKKARLEVDGLTTATTRVLTVQNKNLTIAGVADIGGHIAGLSVTPNVTDAEHDVDITAFVAVYSDSTGTFTLPSAFTKRMDATFAKGTGNGGMGNALVIPTSGQVFIFGITENTTGDADIYGDTSAIAANPPSGWTVRTGILSMFKTNSSANFIPVTVNSWGPNLVEHQIVTPVVDMTTSTQAANTPTLRSLATSVPVGLRLNVKYRVSTSHGSVAGAITIQDPLIANANPAGTGAPLATIRMGTGGAAAQAEGTSWTDTSARVETDSTNGSTTIELLTLSYFFTR
jgi:hypothetical protein